MLFPPSISPAWSSRTKRYVTVGGAVLLGILVWWFADVLPITITAIVLGYLFSPIVSFIEEKVLNHRPLKRVQGRGFAILLTFLLIVAVLVIIVLVIVPTIVGQFEELGRNLPDILNNLVTEAERILSQPLTFNGEPIMFEDKPFIPLERLLEATGAKDIKDLVQVENVDLSGAMQTFIGSVGSVTGPAVGFLGGAVDALVNFMFLMTLTFYLMKDGHHFAQRIVEITPETYRGDVRLLMARLVQVWNAFLRGQIVVAVITGLLIFSVGFFLGLRNAAVLGLTSGLLQLVPNIGPFLAIFPAAFFALISKSFTFPFLSGLPYMLVVILVWIIIQDFVLFVINPRVMGRRLDLHPFFIIVAVIGGASVAGLLGIVLAVPFLASGRVLVQYVYGKLTDTNPFPEAKIPQPESDSPMTLRRMMTFVNDRIPDRLRISGTNGEAVADAFEANKE